MLVSSINFHSRNTVKNEDKRPSEKSPPKPPINSLKYILPAAMLMAQPNAIPQNTNNTDSFEKTAIYTEIPQKTDSDSTFYTASKNRADVLQELGLPYSPRHIGLILRGKIVVIDPGHGGPLDNRADRGTKFRDPDTKQIYLEKDIVLDISRQIKDYLEVLGAKVIMTRDSDVHVELEDRAKMAIDSSANVYLAVHIDEFLRDPGQHGHAMYILNPKNPQKLAGRSVYHHEDSKLLAQMLNESMNEVNYTRPVRDGNYLVVLKAVNNKNQKIAAVLAEAAFSSNPLERKKIVTPEFQEQIAKSLAKGIVMYAVETSPEEIKNYEEPELLKPLKPLDIKLPLKYTGS